MAKKKKGAKKPPALDPIFPLPANTGMPPLEVGEGKRIMKQDEPTMIVAMPYRAFYLMWEQAERRGKENYPKYVGTALDHHARASLEAVHAFRSAVAGHDLPVMPEAKAKKARALLAKMEAEEAARKKGGKQTPEKEEVTKTKAKSEDCPSVKKGVYCLGAAGHKGKHRGITKSKRKVSWSD